jgi:hypothetical protein
MKIWLDLKSSRIPSLSIYTKEKQVLIRYWGRLKFDIVTLYSTGRRVK